MQNDRILKPLSLVDELPDVTSYSLNMRVKDNKNRQYMSSPEHKEDAFNEIHRYTIIRPMSIGK